MNEMKIGSVVFGPVPTPMSKDYLRPFQGVTGTTNPNIIPCNCVGPQPGQTKCPCALRGEAEMGRKMIADGVTINGQHYRLVPDPMKGEQ